MLTPAKAADTELAPTDADAARMERDGFLVVRNLISGNEVARLLEWTAELEKAPEVSGRHWVYHEDSVLTPGVRVIQRIENFCPYHSGFDRFIRAGRLAEWAAALLRGPVLLFKDKINFKMPGGAGFKAHQDQQAGWSVYAPLFITAMVTLDAATLENGCLEIAAGRRREGLIGEQWVPLSERGLDLQPVPTAPGDVIFFDSYVPHASKENRTGTPRRILYLTYNLASHGDQRARYFADKHASFPPDVDRDRGKQYVFRV
ncbi:MAG TPA: phytanoyl-CoA dioxygenase family protein [Steroidobacteraceae bacterium]|nr:phytanoyl-CoA dioxygenase family protein [Steroidobacteraceae bacterium]